MNCPDLSSLLWNEIDPKINHTFSTIVSSFAFCSTISFFSACSSFGREGGGADFCGGAFFSFLGSALGFLSAGFSSGSFFSGSFLGTSYNITKHNQFFGQAMRSYIELGLYF